MRRAWGGQRPQALRENEDTDMNVTVTPEAAARLRTLLDDEGEDAVVRVRESKVGSPCKRKFVLKLSIDMREDEDVEAVVDSLPFVINPDLVDQYGQNFSVTLDEHQMPTVAAQSCACSCSASPS